MLTSLNVQHSQRPRSLGGYSCAPFQQDVMGSIPGRIPRRAECKMHSRNAFWVHSKQLLVIKTNSEPFITVSIATSASLGG